MNPWITHGILNIVSKCLHVRSYIYKKICMMFNKSGGIGFQIWKVMCDLGIYNPEINICMVLMILKLIETKIKISIFETAPNLRGQSIANILIVI